MNTAWNPRFVEFARAHKKTPEEILAEREAGVHETPYFTVWHNERLNEYKRAHPERVFKRQGLSIEFGALLDHDHYDAWLRRWVDESLNGGSRAIEG